MSEPNPMAACEPPRRGLTGQYNCDGVQTQELPELSTGTCGRFLDPELMVLTCVGEDWTLPTVPVCGQGGVDSYRQRTLVELSSDEDVVTQIQGCR